MPFESTLISEKKCNSCKKVKPISEFYRDTQRKDGYYGQCKACHARVVKKWQTKNAEKFKEINKKYKSEHKKQRAEESKRWARAHPDYRRELGRKWRVDHPDYGKNWRLNNKDKIRN